MKFIAIRTFQHTKALLLAGVFLVLFNAVFCYWLVEFHTTEDVYAEIQELPENKVGLVLGTAKWLKDGGINPFFQYRIDAAVELYKAGKVKYILVSGDNGTSNYNEPREMKNALMAAGIPKGAIYMDFAGFRTLDSIVRCKKVFGQNSFTIITQEFHAKRALFISYKEGIKAVAYTAKAVRTEKSIKVHGREVLARVKAFLDIFILHKQPKFLGDPIAIG